MRCHTLFLAVLLAFAGNVFAAEDDLSSEITMEVNPALVEMHTNYSATDVEISGTVAADASVVVTVRGQHIEESYNKRVQAGPIWISSGKVHISGAPSIFLSFTSQPVSEFLDRSEIDNYELDEQAIQNAIELRFEGGEGDADLFKENFQLLKTESGIYETHADALRMEPIEAGQQRFTTVFEWPRLAPPGSYEVTAYACRDGRVVNSTTFELPAELAGVASLTHDFAMNTSTLYGILAALTALLFGIIIDFLGQKVFGKGARAAH